jgi:hypothetical protein
MIVPKTASVRFTIEQIDDLHARLGSAKTFTQYVLALKGLGIERYDSYVADGHSEYFGQGATGSSPHPCTRCFASLKPVNARRSFSTCAGTSGARPLT